MQKQNKHAVFNEEFSRTMERSRKDIKKIGKKGSGILDLLYIVIFFIVIVVVVVLSLFVFNKVRVGLDGADAIPSDVKEKALGFENRFISLFDAGIIFFIFILWAGMIATSFILDNHPIFFIFFAILSFLVFFIGLPLINMVTAIMETDTFAPYFASFPMTAFLVNNWIFVLMFFVITEAVALYAKVQGVGGGEF